MAVESQVRRIEVKIDTSGDRSLKTIAKGFSEVNKSIKSSTNVMNSFKNAFLALQGLSFAGIGVREIVQTADAMQKLGDRLTITEGGAIGAAARLKDLTSVANTNYTSVEDAATIYSRLSMALSDVGVSSREIVTLTDNLQKSFRLSGSTTSEATAAVIQLSQALAAGQLRGQELRSVLEANVVIGGLLSKQLGVTRGQLLKFAEKQGGIKADDFLKAVAAGAKDLNTAVANLKPTIQEAVTKNLNDLKVKLAEVNKEFGISEKVITAINVVFKNLDLILLGAGIYGLVKAVLVLNKGWIALTGAIAPFVPLIISVSGLILNTTIAVGSFVASIASLPIVIGTAIVAFGAALIASSDFRNSILEATDAVLDFIVVGQKTPDLQKKYYEQKTAADELAKSHNQLSRSYVLVDNSINDLDRDFQRTIKDMSEGKANLGPIEKLFDKVGQSTIQASVEIFDFKKKLASLNEELLNKSIGLTEYNKRLKELKIQDLTKDMKEGVITLEEYNKRLKEIEFGKLKNNVKDFQFDLRELNKRFGENGDVYAYSKALNSIEVRRLGADLKDGKTNLLDFNSALNTKQMEEYNREFANGKLKLSEYRQKISELNVKELEMNFRAGKIAAAEFHAEVAKGSEKFAPGSAFYTGVNNYIESAGTISQNVANGITQTFGHLEDSMVEFVKTGKFNFREFTMAVLDDLNRIIIRSLIIRPLAQGILGAISPGAGASAAAQPSPAAKGAAFDGNRTNFFATGGVVSGATPFKFGGGKSGVMGEAGPEAILPLKRGANGDLGVKASPSNVVVNVINQSGAETEQRETTNAKGDRVIDILIVNKVKEGFANGAFDRQMSQQYGLRRKGA